MAQPNIDAAFVTNPRTATNGHSLVIHSVDRYPAITELDIQNGKTDTVGWFTSTSQVLDINHVFGDIQANNALTDKDHFYLHGGQLTACTNVWILSPTHVFNAHYWESLAFEGVGDPEFKQQVLDGFTKNVNFTSGHTGRTVHVQDSLQAAVTAGHFQAPCKAFIVTPRNVDKPLVAGAPELTLFDDRITEIEHELRTMIPYLDVQRKLYRLGDDGFYDGTLTDAYGATLQSGLKHDPTTGTMRKHYPAMEYDPPAVSGYCLLEISRAQGAFRHRAYVETTLVSQA